MPLSRLWIFLSLSLLCFSDAYAACSAGASARVSVLFVNGILTNYSDADDERQAVEDEIKGAIDSGELQADKSCLSTFLVYNPTDGLLNDLFESGYQLSLTDSTIWSIFYGLLTAPSNFDVVSLAQRYLARDLESQTVDQITNLANTIVQSGRLVLVGHSQGNLFVNRAYEDRLSGSTQLQTSVIAVATPADHVPGGRYTTLRKDIIITTIAAGSLQWNADNSQGDGGLCTNPINCHNFINSYLPLGAGRQSGLQIRQQLITVVSLASPTCTLAGNPPGINQGKSTILNWTTTGDPTSATIDGGVGTVNPPGSGSVNVSPILTTNYTMTVTNSAGTGMCSTLVVVNQPPTAGFVMTSAAKTATNGQTLNLTVAPGGSATVSFDGSSPHSSDSDGTVTSWQWKVGTAVVASTPTFPQSFGVGTYNISLVVMDNQGAQSLSATAIVSVANTPEGYNITDLGLLPGAIGALAGKINNSGQVLGYAYTPTGVIHPFVWKQSTGLLDLSPPMSAPIAINDAGNIVGSGNGLYYLYTNGLFTTLPSNIVLTAMNNFGQLTGYRCSQGSCTAVVVSGQTVQDITAQDGSVCSGNCSSQANAINDSGQLAGVISATQLSGVINGSAPIRAFVYTSGSTIDLGTPTNTLAIVTGINQSGEVVGHFFLPTSGSIETSFIWSPGTGLRILDQLPAYASLFGAGINDSGEIIGTAFGLSDQTAFLWTKGSGIKDLNMLLPPSSGWQLVSALGINNSGQIVGEGLHNGQTRAFLLTPQ
jgi:probable HAF family extracellular repeat protein